MLNKSKEKPILILMSKWPAPKRCKSRLEKEIGSFRAAYIQQKLTIHTIEVAKELERKGFLEFKVSVAGIGPKLAKRWGKRIGVKAISTQGLGNLGNRLKKEVLNSQNKKNYFSHKIKKSIIIIGTDLPTLCELDLFEAINTLNTNELVIGPSYDGGYWLIGLSSKLISPFNKLPFDGIKWGTKTVFSETIRKIETTGIKYELLKYKNDLDHLGDLLPWQILKQFPS